MRKRTKSSRQRAHTTHGYGSMKKHRGTGNKGGKGRAGSGKRADSKKPSFWGTRYAGKHGFHSISKKTKSINIYNIEAAAEKYKDGTADLGDLKLLSKGTPTRKWNIKVKAASKKAIEKIEKAGGKVHVPVERAAE